MATKNKLIIAAAGSGKTTFLIEEALRHPSERILITTYTQANEGEFRNRFIDRCGFIPPHVTIQTWFSFLIQHGVRPYQSVVLPTDVKGLLLVSKQSTRGIPEASARQYYLTPKDWVFSDKLSKLAIRCNEKSGGHVIDRMSRVFTRIFIDEVQDLAGYDLEVLKALFSSRAVVVLVGDPRQVVYLTHHEAKHGKYADGKIRLFIERECQGLDVDIDDVSLSASHRSNRVICEISDRLYPEMRPTTSKQHAVTGHDGIFVVREQDVGRYLERYRPAQLRYGRNVEVDAGFPAYTFGDSKGLSFDRVLIYPTEDMACWTLDPAKELKDTTRAKFYVGITRARYSVSVVCKKVKAVPAHITLWENTSTG